MEAKNFRTLGVSGGGPAALACAYRLKDCLKATIVISGIRPLRLPGSLRGMAKENRLLFRLARYSPQLAGWLLARMIRASLAHHIAEHIPGCQATFFPGEGHTGPFINHQEDILKAFGNFTH